MIDFKRSGEMKRGLAQKGFIRFNRINELAQHFYPLSVTIQR